MSSKNISCSSIMLWLFDQLLFLHIECIVYSMFSYSLSLIPGKMLGILSHWLWRTKWKLCLNCYSRTRAIAWTWTRTKASRSSRSCKSNWSSRSSWPRSCWASWPNYTSWSNISTWSNRSNRTGRSHPSKCRSNKHKGSGCTLERGW